MSEPDFVADTEKMATQAAMHKGVAGIRLKKVAGGETFSFLEPSTRPDSLGRIGHYEVLEVLGKGGFGVVFRALDDKLQRMVAVKVLVPDKAAAPPARQRFLREARSSARVRHENVVQVHAVEETPLPYLVMEFIPGETLQHLLDRVGLLETPAVLRIGRQIAEGLAAAHATGLIHRDVKPANVLLEANPGRELEESNAKLTDFGLARAADDANSSQSGIVVGTPMYMSPEQARGEHLDHRSDLFSLGSVLYVMASGRLPFRAEHTLAVLKLVNDVAPRPIPEINPHTPLWLCDIISKLHAKNPQERYQSAREVADVLADFESQLKANSTVTDISRLPCGKSRISGRWKWVAAAAVLSSLIAFGVYAFTRSPQLPQKNQEMVDARKRKFEDRTSLERRAAEHFRKLKIEMIVAVDGKEILLEGGAELPTAAFVILYLKLNANVGSDAIPWLADLSQLRKVYVPPQDADRWAEALAKHPALIMINAYGCDLSDKGLAHFGRLTNLEYLNVHGCQGITAAGLQSLAGCKSLEKLNLDSAMLRAGRYTMADLQKLRQALPRLALTQDHAAPIAESSADPDRRAAQWLRSLGTNRVEVIEADALVERIISHDQPLPAGPFRLVGVSFRGPQVEQLGDGLADQAALHLQGVRLTGAFLPQSPSFTTAGLAKLLGMREFAEVTYLNLGPSAVDDGMFAHLAKLPKLSNLDAGPLPNVTAKGSGALKACPNLQSLTILATPLSPAGIEELQQVPQLKYLNISAAPCTEQHVDALAKLKIQNLIIASADIDDKMAVRLAAMENLTSLSLAGNPLTDKGLAEFQRLKGLSSLDVNATKVTAAGVADLQKALPNCKVQWKSAQE
jgi:serine/threonine protein kinase